MNIDINIVGNASNALERIRLESRRATQTISDLNKSVKNASDSILGMATQYIAMSKAIDVAKKSISDFTDLQEKTLDIAKTTGLAGAELEDFTSSLNKLNQDVRGMELDSLYEISAIAGQLGIKGKENLLAFTQSVQRIAKTSKLTAEQAGEGFAKLANSLQEPIKNIEKLTSTFTILASSTTASEDKLLDFTQRLAGAGKTLGLTTPQIAGIGATLNDVGLTAEVAGTAMSQVFQKILTDTDKLINTLHLDAKSFKEAIQNEPVKAVEMLLQALGKLDKQARIQALKDLQMSGSGLSSTLLKLSANTDKLTKNLNIATEGYSKGTYTIDEFNVATKGLATTQQQLSDQVKQTSASFGKLLAPSVEKVSQTFILLLKDIQNHNQGVLEAVKVVGGLVVAWKAFNIAMSATPFGRILAGLTAILGVAVKIRATMLQNEALVKRGEYLLKKEAEYKKSNQYKIDQSKQLEKANKTILKGIETQTKLLKNASLTAQQRAIIEKNIAKMGQKINTNLIKRRELLKGIKLPKSIKTDVKVNIPKIKPISVPVVTKGIQSIEAPKIKPIEAKISTKGVQEYARKSKTLLNRTLEEFQNEVDRVKLPNLGYQLLQLKKERDNWIKKGVSKDKANELFKIKKAQLYTEERKKALELAKQEADKQREIAEKQKALNASIQDKINKNAMSSFSYQLLQLKKERDNLLSKGGDNTKVEALYQLKVKALKDKKIKQLSEELKLDKKINKELTKSQKRLKNLTNELKNISLQGLERGLDNFAKTGEFDFSDVISSGDLKSANDPLIKALGYTADIISGALSNTPSEFYTRETNVGADNKSVVDSINRLKNDVMINQLSETRKMLNQLELLNSQFKNISLALAPNGSYMNNPNLGDEQLSYNSFGESIANGVSDLIGNNFASDLIGGLATGLFGSTSKKVEHAGLIFGEQTVDSFLQGVDVQSYQDIKKKKKALFGAISSTSYYTNYSEADAQIKEYFQQAIKGQVDIIKQASSIIGQNVDEVNNRILDYKIDIGKLDLLGKSQEEINSIIGGVLGTQLGNITRSALPILEDFKKANEDYATTLIRVSSDYDKAKKRLKDIGVQVVQLADISNKNGEVYAEAVRDSITQNEVVSREVIKSYHNLPKFLGGGQIEFTSIKENLSGIGEIIKGMVGTGDDIVNAYQTLKDQQIKLRAILANQNQEVNNSLLSNFQGLEEYSQLQSSFYENFVSDTQKIYDLQERLLAITTDIPKTKEEYLQLVRNQDLTTEQGRLRYAQLLREQNAFLDLIKLQDEAQKKNKETLVKFSDEWKDAMKNVRNKIQSTIDSIRGNYEKDSNGRIQALSDFSRYRDLLNQALADGNKKNIERYSSRFADTARSLSGFGNAYKNISLRELERIKREIPQDKVQKVEVVGDEKGVALQEAIYRQLDNNNKDNSEIKLLLTRIFNELNYNNTKNNNTLIKG